ncbi:MAG: cation-transporting P-type ATPase [Prosthecobacter sp.]|nr:cation-transporting P-type ATPase [Prosthecobacter sp.]
MPAHTSLNWHAETVENALKDLQTDARSGLTAAEASARLAGHGPNELPAGGSGAAS